MIGATSELATRFVTAFKRGIEGEVAALQASSPAAEAALSRGEDLGGGRYAFHALAREPLVAGVACTLRTPGGVQRATIERVDGARITLVTPQPIDLAAAPITLELAPWFLYERMVQALEAIDAARHHVDTALMLFGKQPPTRAATSLRADHAALDASQQAAVQLCSDSTLAFIWGPPGTGKTVTLASVIEELLAQGKRILLASTTNAAIDQVLARLATRPWFAASVAAGTTLRLGRSDAETFGAELADVVDRLDGDYRARREQLRARIASAADEARQARTLLDQLAEAVAPQRSLFAPPTPSLRSGALARLFTPGRADALALLDPHAQRRVIQARAVRLERIVQLARARLATSAAASRELEVRLARAARLVMCTLTNAYLSPLVADERFDVLIAEEAGMATLPPLFHAACLCRERVIVVGDPRQLPPIVQADDARVRRAIGRTIFEVAVPEPERSDLVAMLESQYRMHPAIGTLVGRVFYGGRLVHCAEPAALAAITERPPFPGVPLTVVDTAGRTTCQRAANGKSRVNPASAEITAELARAAVEGGTASIAVITPYAAHAGELRRRLAAHGIAEAVECSTIHRFQGRECDIVILDLVDAAPMRQSALLADAPNLLNVSISRARGKLVVVADVAYFEATAPAGIVAALLRAARGG
jgi:hypothetical protein